MVEERVAAVLGQRSASVRFEWGPAGASALSEEDGCLIIVDVLSFTTAVSVVTGRGTAVIPYPMGQPGVEAFAAQHDADIAVGRREVTAERPWSLSPAALALAPPSARLVLPSPNGSALSAAADGVVAAGCLRNSSAVAAWAIDQGYGRAERPIAVVAAGERWPDGSLRPAVEDALGAGSILARLRSSGLDLSSEADVAATTFSATRDITASIWRCGSALELVSSGFRGDVELALEVDADDHVALRSDGAFRVPS